MSYNRYDYRRAKKFKLDEDLQVNDVFTGTAKRPLDGWKCWDGRHKAGNVYAIYGNAFNRFIQAHIGMHVDQVYSKFLRQLPASMRDHPDVREDFNRKVATVEEIDGKLYDVNTKHTRQIRNPIWMGDFYRDPKTGILKIVGEGETWRTRYRPKSKKKEPIIIDGLEYKKVRKMFKKRITSGVFTEEYQDIWFKFVRHTYMTKEPVYVNSYEKTPGKRWLTFNRVFSHYKEVENEYFTKQTVSKEDIKKLKLESYEYDIHSDLEC